MLEPLALSYGAVQRVADCAREPRLRRDRAPCAACDRSPACRGGRSGLIVDLNSIELAVSLRFVGSPPHPRGVSSRHVAGDPVNVRAPDRDVKGSPATPKFPCSTLRGRRTQGSVTTRHGHRAHGAQLHSLDPFRFPPEWSAAPVAPSFPDRPPPSTLSDDRRIPPARCPCAPQAREIPRPAPDAYSAGTRNRGGAVHKVTAPPPFRSARPSVDAHTSARRVQRATALCAVEKLLAGATSRRGRPRTAPPRHARPTPAPLPHRRHRRRLISDETSRERETPEIT